MGCPRLGTHWLTASRQQRAVRGEGDCTGRVCRRRTASGPASSRRTAAAPRSGRLTATSAPSPLAATETGKSPVCWILLQRAGPGQGRREVLPRLRGLVDAERFGGQQQRRVDGLAGERLSASPLGLGEDRSMLGAVAVLLRLVCGAKRGHPGHQRQHEQDRDPCQRRPEPSVDPALTLDSCLRRPELGLRQGDRRQRGRPPRCRSGQDWRGPATPGCG